MPASIVSNKAWRSVEPLLSDLAYKEPHVGRPFSSDREALAGILIALRDGHGFTTMSRAKGGVLGLTARRRLRMWREAGLWGKIEHRLRRTLAPTHVRRIDWRRARTV